MAETEEASGPLAEGSQQQTLSQETVVVEDQIPPPTSPFEGLLARLQDHPHDVATWQELVNIAEDSGDFVKLHDAYEALLKVYPNTVQVQIAYLRHSLKLHSNGKPKQSDASNPIPSPRALFSRWLKVSPEVELWKYYLEYIREKHAAQRDTVKSAYESALRCVGQDRDAGDIWKEYIEYIKADPTNNEREGQEKMDLLRGVYRRAVQIPLDNLEQLWREWDAFENNLNKTTAKKFLSDISPAYMTARVKKNELIEHHKRIELHISPQLHQRASLDLPTPPQLTSKDRSRLASWRKYLEFEEENPLDIEEKPQLTARLLAVYRKAVIRMRFFPEIWYLAFLYAHSAGKQDDAHSFLKSGLEANPTSFLLNFAYAEHLEQHLLALQATTGTEPQKIDEKKTEIHEVYKKFTQLLKKDLDSLEDLHISSGGAKISLTASGSQPTSNKPVPAHAPISVEDDVAMKENEIYGHIDPAVEEAKEREREREKENERRAAMIVDKRIEVGQASIAWMRFARRVGQSVGLRNIFKEVRSDKWISWQVFEAAAILEHQISPNSDVSAKIFELGLRSFGNDVDYVVRYLNFLITKGDEANARALFEKSIGNFEPEKARPIWQRWLQYQMNVADLHTLQKLDKRVADIYPKDRAMKLFAQRYTYVGIEVVAPTLGIDAMASHDLQTQLRVPTVVIPPHLIPSPTPLVPSESTYSTNGAASMTNHLLSRGPPARLASPMPVKRALPDADMGAPHKKIRRSPPPPVRRVAPPPARRWERSPPREERRRPERDRSPEYYERGAIVPTSVLRLLSHLPDPAVYDGPSFKIDDFINLVQNTNLPQSPGGGRLRSRSPPSRGVGRGPPDYGPYQGPGSRPTRRY